MKLVKASLAQQMASLASFEDIGKDHATAASSDKQEKTDKGSDELDDGPGRDRIKRNKFFQVKDQQLMYVNVF